MKKKMCLYLKIVSFTVFFGLLLLKFSCCMIGTAVDFVTSDFFPHLSKFLVLIAK